MIAFTPKPPYYAVIFTSLKYEITPQYAEMANHMEELAKNIEGYLGIESARNDLGITVSYWQSKEAILVWKSEAQHLVAQKMGRETFYKAYKVRICLVERDYDFSI